MKKKIAFIEDTSQLNGCYVINFVKYFGPGYLEEAEKKRGPWTTIDDLIPINRKRFIRWVIK